MADNVQLNPGVGGAIIASDEIGAAQYQRIKLTLGGNGVDDGDLASGNPMPVREVRPTTGTVTSVAGSATNVTLLASNTSRLGVVIYNDSTAILYVKFAATASTTSFTYKVFAEGALTVPAPCYTGSIHGIWASATGSARITELT